MIFTVELPDGDRTLLDAEAVNIRDGALLLLQGGQPVHIIAAGGWRRCDTQTPPQPEPATPTPAKPPRILPATNPHGAR